jgi:hypothetical protein
MGSIVGGSTMPGIEVGWKALETGSWGNAFRPSAALQPGDLTFSLSTPWPVDFFYCAFEDVTHLGVRVRNDWWPAARPIDVRPSGASGSVRWASHLTKLTSDADVEWWKACGFIRKNGAGTAFEEVEKP